MPGLDASYFHKLASFAFPWEFSIGNFSIEFIDWALIGSGYEEDILILDEDVIPDSFGLSFN